MELRILTERFEDIAPGTFATDSTQDIANWIVKKPKPYRVIYDRVFDVWCIADAAIQTHKDMAIDLFDSDYLEGVSNNVDSFIRFARNDGSFNFGWTNAEVYCDYQFDNQNIKGFIFIPEGYDYKDYEGSAFYEYVEPISTGLLFYRDEDDFSPSGFLAPLYRKLKIMGALEPVPANVSEAYEQIPLMTIRNQLMKKLGDDYKATGGSMNPKVLISYVDDPKLEFEITPDGKSVAIVTKYNHIPDTIHKKKGIALMRASNILYDYITKAVKDYEKGKD